MGFANGQVFYADIQVLEEIPTSFEIAEVQEFQTIPDKIRFPQSLPILYERLDKWLGRDKVEVIPLVLHEK